MERNVLLESGSCKESNLCSDFISSSPRTPPGKQPQANLGERRDLGNTEAQALLRSAGGDPPKSCEGSSCKGKVPYRAESKAPSASPRQLQFHPAPLEQIPVHPRPAPLTKRKSGQADRECTVYSSKKKKQERNQTNIKTQTRQHGYGRQDIFFLF